MEPLVGEGRRDVRTEPGPNGPGSAVGPAMQAASGFEGQVVDLAQLEGMGRLHWESDRVARLDTASQSYRLALQPLEPPEVQAEARTDTARLEAARAGEPSGTGWPWLRWLVIALIVLAVVGTALVVGGGAFGRPYS